MSLFLAVSWVGLLFVIVIFSGHTHLLFVARQDYSNTCLKRPLKKMIKIGFSDRLSLNAVKSIAECPKRAFCNNFGLHKATICLKDLCSNFLVWPLKTDFTVYHQNDSFEYQHHVYIEK